MLQSTSLLRGKTDSCQSPENLLSASIHFPLAREDEARSGAYARMDCFNPLPSCEGRRRPNGRNMYMQHASIHFPLAREDQKDKPEVTAENASIHFPLAREDPITAYSRRMKKASIHFPLAREDQMFPVPLKPGDSFNPLPSCEGRLVVGR